MSALQDLSLKEISVDKIAEITEASNIDLGLSDLPELPPDADVNEHFAQACEMHNRACLAHICGGYDQAYKIMLTVMKRLEKIVEKDKSIMEGPFFKDVFPTMVNLFVGVTCQFQKVSYITNANKLFGDNDVPGAIDQWTKALNIGGKQLNHVLYGNRSQAYMLQGEWVSALKDAISWIRIRKHFAPPYVIKGQSLLQLQLFSEAVEAFKMAVRYAPGDESVVTNYLTPAEELAAQKKELLVEMAAEDEDDVSSATEYYEDARNCLSEKKYVEALLLLNDALDVMPEMTEARYARARAYFHLTMYEDAEADLKCVIKECDDNPKAHFLMGKVQEALANAESAFDEFGRAMELNPDNSKYLTKTEEAAKAFDKKQEETEQKKKEREAYHEDLTKDWPVCIKMVEGKGRGMFAKRDLKKGEIILKEEPIVSYQFKENAAKVIACDRCLKPIMFTEEGMRIVASELIEEMKTNPEVADQFGGLTFEDPQELVATMKEVGLDKTGDPVPCDFCKNQLYCSQECKQKAFQETHQRLCLGPNPPEGHPMRDLVDFLGKTDLPIAHMFPRLIARMIQYHNVEEKESMPELKARNLWQHLDGNEDDKPDVAIKEQNEVITLCKDAIYDERLPAVYMPNFFWKFASIRARNATSIKIVDPKIPGLEVEAGALCAGISAVNHSCHPNCHYASRDGDFRHSLIADSDIPEGTELTITYVGKNVEYEKRQQLLEHRYSFKCSCDKCKAKK